MNKITKTRNVDRKRKRPTNYAIGQPNVKSSRSRRTSRGKQSIQWGRRKAGRASVSWESNEALREQGEINLGNDSGRLSKVRTESWLLCLATCRSLMTLTRTVLVEWKPYLKGLKREWERNWNQHVCVYERERSGGALYAMAPHMPSMLPDLLTHLGVLQSSVSWKDVLFMCCSCPW